MSSSGQIRPLSVTELTLQIKYNLEENFEQVCVVGEISNLTVPHSGHTYLSIKDKRSSLAGVMFRSARHGTKFELENGQEMLFWGRVSVYGARGVYQLIIDKIEPVGMGALQLAFEQLKTKLQNEGLFAEEKKRPLPFIPQGIGIVTSPTGAAIQDLLKVLKRRYPGIPILINPVLVQGENAGAEIALALDQFQQLKDKVDLLIVGRGGGSLEDLWPFNEEIVARAIFRSSIPVISAVGHETDFTIADYVSDLRAATPSVAGELAVPLQGELLSTLQNRRYSLVNQIKIALERKNERLLFYQKRLRSPEWAIQSQRQLKDELTDKLYQNIQSRLVQQKHKVSFYQEKLVSRSPRKKVESYLLKLEGLNTRLVRNIKQQVAQKQQMLGKKINLIKILDPYSVLARGYGIISNECEKITNSVKNIKQGDLLRIRLQDGSLVSRVVKIVESDTPPG
jgi:exodeoxyribonuclease VII large subunit